MKKYPKAPITEALISINVELFDSKHDFKYCFKEQELDYPSVTEINRGTGQINFGPQIQTVATTEQVGFLFSSKDKKQMFQSRFDGFTFNKLAPYESWESMRDEAKKLWTKYQRAFKIKKITRIAVRYINRIDIPINQKIESFFNGYPHVPTISPSEANRYLIRVEHQLADIEAKLILNQVKIVSKDPKQASIILDIDVYKELTNGINENEMWEIFEKFRLKKNEIFESFLTSKTRKLFT